MPMILFTIINVAVTLRDFFDGPTWRDTAGTIKGIALKHHARTELVTVQCADLIADPSIDETDDWE